jgi:hypothetical protein
MTHDHHSSSAAVQVPSQMLAQHREGWHTFTRFIVVNCLAVAALLVFLLLVFKVF